MANIVPNKLGSITPWAYHTLQWFLQILWSAHFELGAQQKVVISQTTGKQRGEDVAKQLNSLIINKNWHTMVPNPVSSRDAGDVMDLLGIHCFLAPKGLLNEKRTWQQHKKFTMFFPFSGEVPIWIHLNFRVYHYSLDTSAAVQPLALGASNKACLSVCPARSCWAKRPWSHSCPAPDGQIDATITKQPVPLDATPQREFCVSFAHIL